MGVKTYFLFSDMLQCFVLMVKTQPVRRALVLGCTLQLFQQLCGINTVMYAVNIIMQMYYATSFYSCCSPLKTSSFFSFYSYYSGSILRVSGFPSSLAIWLSCIPFTVNFLCTFIGIYAVEKAGRRVLTLLSFIGRFLRVIQVFMLVS